MPLIEAIQSLAFARELPQIQQIVRTASRSLTGADGASFVLRENDQCHYLDEDAIAPLWKGMRFPMETCVSGWCMAHRQAAVIPDIEDDSRVPVDLYRSTFVRSMVLVPIRSLDPVGVIGVYWSERHRATREQVRLLEGLADATAMAMENVLVYEELEQRVRERTRELECARTAAQQALDAAERANRSKSHFLAAASHDLRQPLQVLALLSGSLRAMIEDPEALDILDRQDHTLATSSRLVNTLLDMSRLESGAIKPEITDFAIDDLVREMRPAFASLAASKGLQFSTETTPVRVHSDPVRVGEILDNLLSNAIKYTREGQVNLCVTTGANAVCVKVRDTGIGIPDEHLQSIFDEFYQVHPPQSRAKEGYGLGLSIVERTVKLLELRLDVQSEPGKGTEFTLELPRSAS